MHRKCQVPVVDAQKMSGTWHAVPLKRVNSHSNDWKPLICILDLADLIVI